MEVIYVDNICRESSEGLSHKGIDSATKEAIMRVMIGIPVEGDEKILDSVVDMIKSNSGPTKKENLTLENFFE